MDDNLKNYCIDDLLTEVIERTLHIMHQRNEITEGQYENFSSVDDCLEIMIERMDNYIEWALAELEKQQTEVNKD